MKKILSIIIISLVVLTIPIYAKTTTTKTTTATAEVTTEAATEETKHSQGSFLSYVALAGPLSCSLVVYAIYKIKKDKK
jgi:uncharacterized protein HemX